MLKIKLTFEIIDVFRNMFFKVPRIQIKNEIKNFNNIILS